MSYTISFTHGVDGAWITKLNTGQTTAAINLPSEITLATLSEWLNNPTEFPATYYKQSPLPAGHREIFYDLETGKLVLFHPVKTACQFFDPSSEESMAKLVRVLKRLVETYERDAINTPLPLPEPTTADMARRTIFTNVGVPDGVGKYTRAKSSAKLPASRERSEQIASKIMSELFDL